MIAFALTPAAIRRLAKVPAFVKPIGSRSDRRHAVRHALQAAEALGVSLATLDRRVIPAIETVRTEWGSRLIPVDELERYLAERRQEARAARRRPARPGRKPGL